MEESGGEGGERDQATFLGRGQEKVKVFYIVLSLVDYCLLVLDTAHHGP